MQFMYVRPVEQYTICEAVWTYEIHAFDEICFNLVNCCMVSLWGRGTYGGHFEHYKFLPNQRNHLTFYLDLQLRGKHNDIKIAWIITYIVFKSHKPHVTLPSDIAPHPPINVDCWHFITFNKPMSRVFFFSLLKIK